MPPTLTGGSPTEMEEQVGWSVVDVDSFVATNDFLVASGEFDDDTLDEDLAEVEGDIVTDVEGKDHEEHPDQPTAFDYDGAPTRFAHDDGRIAASSETDAVRGWLDDEESLADDDAYADVAKALDEEAYAAVLLPMTGSGVVRPGRHRLVGGRRRTAASPRHSTSSPRMRPRQRRRAARASDLDPWATTSRLRTPTRRAPQ